MKLLAIRLRLPTRTAAKLCLMQVKKEEVEQMDGCSVCSRETSAWPSGNAQVEEEAEKEEEKREKLLINSIFIRSWTF